MTMLSDLPHDLVEEILSMVLRTSLGAVRSTCKLWNRLSKNRILCKAEARHQFLVFTMMNHRLYSIRFNLHGIGKDGEEFVDPSIKPIGNILDQVEISKVFYCDGLLLCVTRDHSRRLVVWNPYLGQTRWIQRRNDQRIGDKYALGYDNNNKNHKILRFFDYCQGYEIYDLKSNSWSLFDAIPNWVKYCYERGMSLNGNTYFKSCQRVMDEYGFIFSFDFTTERFGQILPLPFRRSSMDTWTLSCVREEKLAVLYQQWKKHVIEIWVTIKIEPNAALWSKFLRVDMEPPIGLGFMFDVYNDDSFFIDEEKKVILVFSSYKSYTSMAYIIGDNRHLKTVDLKKVANSEESVEIGGRVHSILPLMRSSSYYVPSLVQIDQFTGKRRRGSTKLKMRRGSEPTRCNSLSVLGKKKTKY